jgi:hypothetical protein
MFLLQIIDLIKNKLTPASPNSFGECRCYFTSVFSVAVEKLKN